MQIRTQERQIRWTTAALVAFILLNTQTLAGQIQPPAGSIVLTSWISMISSAVVDSFDSNNPLKSSNGIYDSARRQMNGNIFTTNSTGSDLRNAYVYGSLFYSGPAVRNTANVQGVVATPFNATIAAVNDPVWSDGTFVQYSGGGHPPANGTFIANGTIDNPTRIKVVGDFTVAGGMKFFIVTDMATDRYLTVWVTGKFNTSGSGRLNQAAMAHVTWIVDKDVTTSGDTYKNLSNNAGNVSLKAVGTGKVTLGSSTSFIGAINAPGRAVSVSGTGGLSGGIIANTLTLGSGSPIHCDEALSVTP